MSDVQWRFFVPLDRLDLADASTRARNQVRQLRFGPCEVALLDRDDLKNQIPVIALDRFEERYRFPTDRLAGFYWLIVPAKEEAGPVWKRDRWAFLDMTVGEIGKTPLYESPYATPVESGLFVILLSLPRGASDGPWEPFAVPWIYSLTNDPFAEPERTPNPSALSWTLVGDEYDEVEVPDRSDYFEVDAEELECSMVGRWERLMAALQRVGTNRANFHPLTKHFFVKAFTESGIDQVIANLSCLEATLMLTKEKRIPMMKRLVRLVGDPEIGTWAKDGYDLRDKYLHSRGTATDAISWKDLAKIRRVARLAVDKYIELTGRQGNLTRRQLLKQLAP